MKDKIRKGFNILSELAAFLLLGTAAALIWANLDFEGYEHFVEDPWTKFDFLGHHYKLTFHFLVNDGFMVLFFGIAMKEVAESFLPGGALSSRTKAALPVVSTLGGVVGPVAIYVVGAHFFAPEIMRGWAIPTATDIAYCWLFASLIFGRKHPAVTFLLVLAVLDDLIGMIIIAVFYTESVHPSWLLLLGAAMAICEGMRRFGVKSHWLYLMIGGPMSWLALHNTGVHAALALVPIVPFMPHAARDTGMFQEEEHAHDTMNQFEHFFKPIVDLGLFTFGLANAGVLLSSFGAPTVVLLTAILAGKTFGIFGFTAAGRAIGLALPTGLTMRHIFVMGMVAGIGFTVALFVTTVAFPPTDPNLGMIKMGALLSFVAGPASYLTARLLGLKAHNEKFEEGSTYEESFQTETPHVEASEETTGEDEGGATADVEEEDTRAQPEHTEEEA